MHHLQSLNEFKLLATATAVTQRYFSLLKTKLSLFLNSFLCFKIYLYHHLSIINICSTFSTIVAFSRHEHKYRINVVFFVENKSFGFVSSCFGFYVAVYYCSQSFGPVLYALTFCSHHLKYVEPFKVILIAIGDQH